MEEGSLELLPPWAAALPLWAAELWLWVELNEFGQVRRAYALPTLNDGHNEEALFSRPCPLIVLDCRAARSVPLELWPKLEAALSPGGSSSFAAFEPRRYPLKYLWVTRACSPAPGT